MIQIYHGGSGQCIRAGEEIELPYGNAEKKGVDNEVKRGMAIAIPTRHAEARINSSLRVLCGYD